MNKKTNYENGFKAQVALEAIRGNRTVGEIASEYKIASCLVSKWKNELETNAGNAFGAKKVKSSEEQEQKLYGQIGKLTMEVDYLKKLYNKYL
jgi:transposase